MPGNTPPILPIPHHVHDLLLEVKMHDDGQLVDGGGAAVYLQVVAGAGDFSAEWDAASDVSAGVPVASMNPDAFDIIRSGEWNDGYVDLGDALYGFQLYETDAGLDMRPVEIEMSEGAGAGFVQSPAPGIGSGLLLALGVGMVVAGAWRRVGFGHRRVEPSPG